MAVYHYTSVNYQGDKQKGILEADNEKHCRELLRAKNLIPTSVIPTKPQRQKSQAKLSFSSPKIKTKELALITRQLATLLAAGLPIEEVLNAITEQADKSKAKTVLSNIRSRVLEGHSLANACRDYPDSFSDLYCDTIAAGEKSGHLDAILERLADYIENQHQMRQKISHALIYPGIMICVSFGIVTFLLEFVVPKMMAVYSDMDQALPFITQVLLGISDGLKSYGLLFILFSAVVIYFFRKHFNDNLFFKERVQKIFLTLPIMGNAIKAISTARFARTFAILSGAGVSVLEAMHTASQLITSLPIRKSVEAATNHIREGASIHLALKQTNYFPPMSIHLIASGENSGQLEPMLERVANNQDNEIRQLIDTLLTLFEPAIIVVMGAVVLFIVLAILLPIFQLDQMTG